jgi:DNA-binding NarL/FixJ family response regulator
MVRIVLADDHPIVREGLRAVLETQPDFSVVAECANGEDVRQRVIELQPDVILMDLEMPVMDGVETIRQLRRLARSPRIIVFTAFDSDERIISAIQAGADGYLLKGEPREEIFKAIHLAMQGGSLLQPVVASKLIRHLGREARETRTDSTSSPSNLSAAQNKDRPPMQDLTERELEVLHLLAQGMPNKEIAAHLVISERTAKFHVSSIMGKLGATNRTEAVAVAVQHGLITL